jgi:uncharacterized protein (DUF58 family)
MSFAEVREYRIGDDVRDIDWNVTARSSKAHIKIYEEERELTVMLLVDVSGSSSFGTTAQTKKGLQAEIAAVLAFSASQTGDKVGCMLFSDRVEKFIPPKKGRAHILAIIRQLLEFTPEGHTTSLAEPLRYLSNVLPKRSTAFVLSDFLFPVAEDKSLRDALKIATGKHDLVAVRVDDRREGEMPDVGIAEFEDAETGRKMWVDTSSRSVRDGYRAAHDERVEAISTLLKHYKVDTAACHTGEDYVAELIKLFRKR